MGSFTTTATLLSQLFILAFMVASITSFSNHGVPLITKYQKEFDYFMLALQWPSTYCRRTNKCCQKNGCCQQSGPPQYFTIHGLWPDYNDGSWPECCSDSSFDMKEVSTLSDAIDKYWPTLSCSSPSTCDGHKGTFWAHEWGKHGTCAYPVIQDEYTFFLTTLNVYFKYNVTDVLNGAGYVPSNSEKYPLGGIVTAIENAFHHSPLVVCSGDAIKEIRLCFYKDFKPRVCSITTSCPKFVSLPICTSLGYENVGALKSITI